MELKLYVENLKTYAGMWTLADEVENALKAIGCLRETGEIITEWRIDCWDVEGGDIDLSEYASIEEIHEYQEDLAWWNDKDLFFAACEYEYANIVMSSGEGDWLLLPDVFDDWDLGEYYFSESQNLDTNDILFRYFDYETYGRDIRLEANGMYSEYGWIERIG